jgi:hypothetical protein
MAKPKKSAKKAAKKSGPKRKQSAKQKAHQKRFVKAAAECRKKHPKIGKASGACIKAWFKKH